MERQFAGHTFERVGEIQPERGRNGGLVECRPETLPNVQLHRYGRGPFCRFSVAQRHSWRAAGVFVITCDDAARSVGETLNLARFWNHRGGITPSAVRQQGGQQTHCRINSLILDEAERGANIVLWFHPVENDAVRKELKVRLVAALNPAWDLASAGRGSSNPVA